MRSTPSVGRETTPHEDREEPSGDCARPPAERASQPTACGEPPHGAGPGCASFPQRGWRNALQQVFGSWGKDGSTQPRPRQQSHHPWSQVLAGVLLDRIKPTSTQQGVRQSHTDLPLQLRRGREHKLVQQIQQGGDLALTLPAVEQGDGLLKPGYHNFQHGVQLLAERAHAIGYATPLSAPRARPAALSSPSGRVPFSPHDPAVPGRARPQGKGATHPVGGPRLLELE